MTFAAADAHIHLADLLDRDPLFPDRISVEILSGKSRITMPIKEGDSPAVHWS
jgi:hypothetical protein